MTDIKTEARVSFALSDLHAGDWVRFYQNGKPVIGVVQYLTPLEALTGVPGTDEVCTDIGRVSVGRILEVRCDGMLVGVTND
jgi:hypothetical protein